MDIKVGKTQTGITISQDVICSIANEAVKEIKGIHGLSAIPMKSLPFVNTIKGTGRPVKISYVSDSAHIDMGITVNLNHKIKEVAEQVQAVVKNAVQDMTGIAVSKVNVFVTGIYIKNEDEI